MKTAAEFFSGIGLMRLGLERSGWRVVFANDIAPEKIQMYENHFGRGARHIVTGDIHQLRPEDIPGVQLATASFPCNDLSLAGAMTGLGGKHSSAFWGFVEILRKMRGRRPPLLLIENVPGFLSSHGGRDFAAALLALNGLGYSVDPFLLNAAWFVPQSRQRLFIVASLASGGRSESISASPLRPPALMRFISAHPEIRWDLAELPPPPKMRLTLEDILEKLPDDAPEWWPQERADYLFNQMSGPHQTIARQMMAQKRHSYGAVFRRMRNGKSMAELRVDGLAGCLRTPRGGSGRQILFKAGHGKCSARLLTPRECARLMGAGDFRVSGTLNQSLFGFGDAVCVPAIEWIANNYLNRLVGCQPLEEHIQQTARRRNRQIVAC